MTENELNDVFEQCHARMRAGEHLDDILQAYPREAEAVRPALEAARAFGAAHARVLVASAASRGAALRAMTGELEAARCSPASAGRMPAWLAMWRVRPAMRAAFAAGAAVMLLGVVGVGATAATGSSNPVSQILRITSNSAIKTEFEGVIVGIEGDMVRVDAGGDVRTVLIDDATEITRGGDTIPKSALEIGQIVEVHGRLLADNQILARRFHLEDRDDVSPAAAAATGTPAAVPTADAEDDDCDNSGPGSHTSGPSGCERDHHDEDDDDCDNSGPGSHTSGPGGCERDHHDEDGDDGRGGDDADDSGHSGGSDSGGSGSSGPGGSGSSGPGGDDDD